MKVKSLSRVRHLATPWAGAHQAPPSTGFSRQEYWTGMPLPSPSRPPFLWGGDTCGLAQVAQQDSEPSKPQWRNAKESIYQRRRCGFNPWVRRSPGGGNGIPLQCSCLENPMDRGAWWATVHGVAKSWTRSGTHIPFRYHPVSPSQPLFLFYSPSESSPSSPDITTLLLFWLLLLISGLWWG